MIASHQRDTDLSSADPRPDHERQVEDYVEAARAMGNPRWRIALFISCRISCACWCRDAVDRAAIIAEAALSFLGLGQQPPRLWAACSIQRNAS